MKCVLITGATGFIGRNLSKRLADEGICVRGTVNSKTFSPCEDIFPIMIGPIGPETNWAKALMGVDTVIHLAARVHVMVETSSDPLAEFRYVNSDGTESLARQAAQAGVKRFIFLSTIGVNGDCSGERPYSEVSKPEPHNFYSLSKHEAELKLLKFSSKTGMEVVIIRAPLVYGPENPGNFLSLLKAIRSKIPLPLASISNRRSFIYVGNLVDVLALVAVHPAAAGKIYLVSDGEDISTPELLYKLSSFLEVHIKLFAFPLRLLKIACKSVNKSKMLSSLSNPLIVDSSKVRNELGWKPPYTLEQGLRNTAYWFRGVSD